MNKRGLKFKLVISGILIVVIPLTIIAFVAVDKASTALMEVGKSEAMQIARSLATMTDLVLENELNFAKAHAVEPLVVKTVQKVYENGIKNSLEDLKALDRFLATTFHQVENNYGAFFVADANGAAIADSTGSFRKRKLSVADREYFKIAARQGKANIGNPVKSKNNGQPIIVIAVPLKAKSGEFAGLLGINIKIESLSARISKIKPGKTGYPFLIDKKGLVIIHPRKELIFEINISDQKGMEAITPRVLNFETGAEEYRFEGVDKIAGYAPVPITDWMVLITKDKSEFVSPATAIRNLIVMVGGIFLFLTILAVLWFTGTITGPIKKLIDVLDIYGKGDTSVRADVDTGDEIGYLAEKFNAMLELINLSAQTLKDSESKYRQLFNALQDAINTKKYSFKFTPDSKKDDLAISLNKMLETLDQAETETNNQNWLKTGQNDIASTVSGERDLSELCRKTITFIANYVDAQVGTFFVKTNEGEEGKEEFRLIANYAFRERKGLTNRFKPGEGLAGQAALEKEKILFTDVPRDYIKIESSLGSTTPTNIFVLPLVYENDVKGVIELGSVTPYTKLELQFIELAGNILTVALNTAMFNSKLATLLEQTKNQSIELKEQQEELKAANEELEEQTTTLKESEAKLQLQQEELQANNEELEEKTEVLENQKNEIEDKNTSLRRKQREVEEKARQIELATRYKSEFLANMSHELRTPLNSLLILANMLAENEEKNLNADQVESAASIHRSGQNLLHLINDILDLSKIEAKKIELHLSKMSIETLGTNCKAEFAHMAKEKGIGFDVNISRDLPRQITTDEHRLNQIIRNLMGNAIKFTEKGSVSLSCFRPGTDVKFDKKELEEQKVLAICISDTGPGIPEDRLQLIFQAFKQVDGSISRRHGGTGLGLSISRELASLIGGELQVKSRPGKGSVFTLYIPQIHIPVQRDDLKLDEKDTFIIERKDSSQLKTETKETAVIEKSRKAPPVKQGKSTYSKTMLIIEDDNEFAAILANFFQKNGYESIIASNGETGIKYVIEHHPTAIILDIGLPGIDGWAVLNELKNNPATRHIPVHIMSAFDETRQGLEKGAVGYLTKPVDSKGLQNALNRIDSVLSNNVKELLIIEDNKELQMSIMKLMKTNDINSVAVETGKNALKFLKKQNFDCMILDIGLPDINGFELLDIIDTDPDLEQIPVIVYTGRDLTCEETEKLEKYSSSIVLKNAVSMERLLDETALFMHRVENNMPEQHKKMIQDLRNHESILPGKKVLLVDDDMRNAFALNKFLKSKGMEVMIANNGKKALEILGQGKTPDIVLMDIMMPVMDGYETMQRIREQEKFKNLPILALTAKAMESDREECIKCGANDYLSKPVDTSKLLTMLRVWLYG